MTFASFSEWKKYGVFVDRIHFVSPDQPTKFYISVPETSDMIDDKGNEMSGKLLARRVKRSLGDKCEVVYAIRAEHWKNPKPAPAPAPTPPALVDLERRVATSNVVKDIFAIFFGFGNEFAR